MVQQSDMQAKDKPIFYHLGHWYSLKKDYITEVTYAGLIRHTHEI